MQQLTITRRKPKDPFKLSEHELMTWCISYLSLKGHYVQRINSGKIPIFQNGRINRVVKLAEPGTPDIVGFTKDGRYIGLEIKIKPNKPSPVQQEFIDNLNRCGGIGAVIYSQEEMMEMKDL